MLSFVITAQSELNNSISRNRNTVSDQNNDPIDFSDEIPPTDPLDDSNINDIGYVEDIRTGNPYMKIPNFTVLNITGDFINLDVMSNDNNTYEECQSIMSQIALFGNQIMPCVEQFIRAIAPDNPDQFYIYNRYYPGIDTSERYGFACRRIYISFLHANGFSYPTKYTSPPTQLVPLCVLLAHFSEDEIITKIYEESARIHRNSTILNERHTFVIPDLPHDLVQVHNDPHTEEIIDFVWNTVFSLS